MATVVNNPGGGDSGVTGGAGVVIGAVLVVLVLIVVLVYSLPYIRKEVDEMTPENPTIKVEIPNMPSLPTPSGTTTQ